MALPKIKVKLSGGDVHRLAGAFTRIRLGSCTFDVPFQHGRARAAAFQELRDAIQARFDATERNPVVHAEIIAAAPRGGAVPHGDVIGVLDVLMDVGIEHIVFEGAAPPLPISEHGHGP